MAIVAVVTKALGVFLILFLFLLPYYRSDPAHAPRARALELAIVNAIEEIEKTEEIKKSKETTESKETEGRPGLSESSSQPNQPQASGHLSRAKEHLSDARNLTEGMRDELNQASSQIRRLEAENERLRKQDKEGVDALAMSKRWFTIFVAIDNCPGQRFVIYVRSEGKLTRMDTKEEIDAEEFLVTQPAKQTRVVGESYFDSSGRAHPGGSIVASKPGIQMKIFHAVAAGTASYSLYVAAMDPEKLVGKTCEVLSAFDTWPGRFVGTTVSLDEEQPYAWLRRFTINADGTNTFGTSPEKDSKFRTDLQSFSRKQRELLCTSRPGKCSGKDEYYFGDAHYYALRPFARFKNHHIVGASYAGIAATTLQKCEEVCLAQDYCGGVEYDTVRARCRLYRDPPQPSPGAGAVSSIKRAPNVLSRFD